MNVMSLCILMLFISSINMVIVRIDEREQPLLHYTSQSSKLQFQLYWF
jgi:hypothetical protein